MLLILRARNKSIQVGKKGPFPCISLTKLLILSITMIVILGLKTKKLGFLCHVFMGLWVGEHETATI